MENKKTYGIGFITEVIDDKNILLRTSHLIEGVRNNNGDIVDKYEKVYKNIQNLTKVDSIDDFFGFGVSVEDLQRFFRERGYSEYQVSQPITCANLYLEFAKRYVFILEKSLNRKHTICHAINLYTKNSTIVYEDENIMSQLIDELMFSKQKEKSSSGFTINGYNEILYNPKDLLQKVTERVVGQDEAAFELVSTVCKNIKYSHIEGMKSNILLYGPTGCGKTELVRSLAKEMSLPLVIEDVTNYTANGYVGDSVKNILNRLYSVSNNNMHNAERGIVFLDEFDKLASPSSNKTVNKTDVQEELLKIVEGAKINLNDTNKTKEQLIMDTSNITFILGGAFTELLEAKKKKKPVIGFNNQASPVKEREISNEDFIKYGIIPEMVGRIPIKIAIRQLEPHDLETLLTKSSISCLKMYETALLSEDKVTVVYENKEDFVSKIAHQADALHSGARGLKTIVDKTFLPAVNEIGENVPTERELVVNSDTIDNPKSYVLRKIKRDNYELSKGIREAD